MENKVYYLVEKSKFKLQNEELKTLPSNYVRVEYLYCGICGGDYSCFLGRRENYPYSLGHEFVAKVVEVGRGVLNFSKGDLVVSDFNYRCGKCFYCKNGIDHLCKYNSIKHFSNRAFAKYADIDYKYLYKLKPLKSILSGTLIEPLSCVIHAYNEIKEIYVPKNILIVGMGGIGMLFAFYAKIILKIDKVYVHDIIEAKKQRIIDLFGCHPLNIDSHIKYDLIIDATNSISGALLCLNIAKSYQKYCMMSHLYGLETSFIYETMCQKEIHPLFPLRNGNGNNLLKAMDIICDFWNAEYSETLEVYPLENIQSVFENKAVYLSNKQILSTSSLPHLDIKLKKV